MDRKKSAHIPRPPGIPSPFSEDPPSDPLTDDPGPLDSRDDLSLDPSGKALRYLRLSERIADLGSADPESETFLAEIVGEIARRTFSRKAVLTLVGVDSGMLETRASYGFDPEPPAELERMQDGIHGWVVRIGSPMVVEDPDRSAALPLLPFERTQLLAVPVSVGGDRLGCVSVLEPSDSYAEEDMLFLSTAGSLLGGMVGHSRATVRGQDSVRRTIESLSVALDARDPYTRGHSQRVAMYSLAIANELETTDHHSFMKDRRNSLLMSALLHDIGKIGIRDEVLLKPGALTAEEYELVKTHPQKGAAIVRMIPGFDESVIAGILQHHERWDGKGYPAGLAGEKIHIFGRIIGLADCFDAIVTSRPYSTAASYSYAMQRVEELAGAAFDREVVQAMLRALKDQSVWAELGAISSGGPDPVVATASEPEADSAEKTLRRIFGRSVNDLPTLPHVVQQVLEKTRDADTSLDMIVNLIATDQALVTTYLKLVNSAFYGFSRRITTLKQAITLLGFRSVRNIVVNAGVVGIFRKRMFNGRHRYRLWNHSVTCAVAARVLAERVGYKAKEEAFTAGLLHDIGKIVIDQYAPKDSARIMAMVDEGRDPREAELEVLGADHTKIGSWIGDRWQLPKSLCWVIEYHHDPEADTIPAHRDLVKLIAVANRLSRIRGQEPPDRVEAQITEFVDSPANLMQLTSREAREVLEEVWAAKSEAMKTFGPGMSDETVAEVEQQEEAGAEPAGEPQRE